MMFMSSAPVAVFESGLATFHQGQLKKVVLTRSLMANANVMLWNEPLN